MTEGAGPFRQLPLAFPWPAGVRLASFVAGANAAALDAVTRLAAGDGGFAHLSGEPASGKTHLLQAACAEAGAAGLTAAYVPLAAAATGGWDPGILEGLEGLALVCLDDLDRVAGDCRWEQALLHLYNRCRDAGRGLLVASRHGPQDAAIRLADLRSRLAWGLGYRLAPLDDDGRLAVLAGRARLRGLDLPEAVGRYLLSRYPRDLPTLVALLDRLDAASLAEQRALTVPFVRSLLP